MLAVAECPLSTSLRMSRRLAPPQPTSADAAMPRLLPPTRRRRRRSSLPNAARFRRFDGVARHRVFCRCPPADTTVKREERQAP